MNLLDLAVLQSAADGTLTRSERARDRRVWYMRHTDMVTAVVLSLMTRGLVTVGLTNGQDTAGVLTPAGRDTLARERNCFFTDDERLSA